MKISSSIRDHQHCAALCAEEVWQNSQCNAWKYNKNSKVSVKNSDWIKSNLTQVGVFSYELLQNIKELKIYQDIFDMDAKLTCHEMKIVRSFSLSSLQMSACLPESCYCSFCRNTEYYLIKFSEYDNYFKVHKCVALWSVWSSERWSHGWPQSHPFCQFCELAQEKYQFWQIKNVLRLSW